MKTNIKKKGIGMIEIIIAVFILTMVLGILITVNNLYIKSSNANVKMTKGAYLATEGIEAIKTIRDSGWNNINAITPETDFYLYFDNQNSLWFSTSTVQETDGFIRKIKIFDVYRNDQEDISESGVLDPNTKKIEVTVSWNSISGQDVSKKIVTYITNILEE